ncbi:MAG: hypothetical protein JWQ25_2482 [Daejeonella sp.]|nr:hypothetical protein [Daejeonella sp.]
MENNQFDKTTPEQTKGTKTDTSASIELDTNEEALNQYRLAKHKLLNISHWHTYSGAGTADFQLTDSGGNAVRRLAEKGDHFRIDIPGPGSKTGDGFDWVQIQEIKEETGLDSDQISIIVQPATNPNNANPDTAHFFKDDASSTFIVRREGKTVIAEVHGRNERPNTEAESLIDKARNIAVAAGAMLGLSKVQWKSLVEGLVDPKFS